MREFELIDQIRRRFERPDGVVVGIGDDAAVLEAGRYDLVTTDTMVEGVHFRRDWSSAAQIGWKALAVSLSDIAAMGGEPGAFFLNLTVAPGQDSFVDGVLGGLAEICEAYSVEGATVSVAGGDVSATDGAAVLTTTLLGRSPADGPILRGGAQAGDRVVVLGPTGLAQAGVDLLAGRLEVDPQDFGELLEAHRRPRPLVEAGRLVGANGLASALIDTSDGFGQDLGHILEQSGVGARVEVDRLPRHPQLDALCHQTESDPLEYMLAGGEDLQLCMTVPAAKLERLREVGAQAGFEVFDVGQIHADLEGVRFVGPGGDPVELDVLGYQHFAVR
jgi:thiamine-monophosphate kinase